MFTLLTSFRAKLICTLIGLQFFTLALIGVAAAVQLEGFLEASMARRVTQLKPALNAALAVPMAQRDYASVAAIIEELHVSKDLIKIEIFDIGGRRIASSGTEHGSTPVATPGTEDGGEQLALLGFFHAADPLHSRTPIVLAGQTMGEVAFSLSRQELDHVRDRLVLYVIAVGLLMSILIVFLIWILSFALTRPLDMLVTATVDLRAGNFDLGLDLSRTDEFGTLMRAFNRLSEEMQRRISELVHSESLQRHYLAESMTRSIALDKALANSNAANEAKSQFIAHMSHEIRTPLNSIIGLSEHLASTPLTADQEEQLRLVRSAGEAVLVIVNDVLDFSKMSAGHVELREDPIRICTMLSDIVASHQPSARRRELQLSHKVDSGVPDMIVGDPARIRQVLDNLIANSLKFTEQGGVEVRLDLEAQDTAATDTVNGVGAASTLRFTVSDTGIGIAADKFERIFEPFAQEDHSITRRFGGTGLGLAISRRLARAMGGDISVRSEQGKGSQFAFSLRAMKPDPEARLLPMESTPAVQRSVLESKFNPTPEVFVTETERPQVAVSGMTEDAAGSLQILVVDDTPANVLVVQLMLSRLGFRVRSENDGLAGVRAWQALKPDLILMDLQMPVLDGLGATKRIRELESQQGLDTHTPIIALTAHTMRTDVVRCLDAGMDDFLSKPVRIQKLTALIERWREKVPGAQAPPMAR